MPAMCGRFALAANRRAVADLFDLAEPPTFCDGCRREKPTKETRRKEVPRGAWGTAGSAMAGPGRSPSPSRKLPYLTPKVFSRIGCFAVQAGGAVAGSDGRPNQPHPDGRRHRNLPGPLKEPALQFRKVRVQCPISCRCGPQVAVSAEIDADALDFGKGLLLLSVPASQEQVAK